MPRRFGTAIICSFISSFQVLEKFGLNGCTCNVFPAMMWPQTLKHLTLDVTQEDYYSKLILDQYNLNFKKDLGKEEKETAPSLKIEAYQFTLLNPQKLQESLA